MPSTDALRPQAKNRNEWVASWATSLTTNPPVSPATTVAVANVAHLSADPALSRRYGAIDQPEPFEIKRPISRNAVALSLGLSYETARRRIP